MDLGTLSSITNLRFWDEAYHKRDRKGIWGNLLRNFEKLQINYWECILKVFGLGIKKCKSCQYEDEQINKKIGILSSIQSLWVIAYTQIRDN